MAVPSGRPGRNQWLLIMVLLVPAIVVPLLVPLYDEVDPKLFGFPFFFWFQFALILFAAGLTWLAFKISQAAERRDRGARR